MNALVGTGALIRLILRRDRIVLPIWIVLVALLAAGIASSFVELYPTTEALQAAAGDVAASPAVIALLGRVFAPTLGGLTAWRWTTPGVVLVGLASLLTVVRHTRTEEETGRRELLGATVVGRQAPLSAALIVTFAANLVMAALVVGALASMGLPVAGSIALGLSAAAVGWTIAAVAGVAAQLTGSAGAAKGMAGVALGLFYLMRAVGDAGESSGLAWLSWLSPVGWARFTRPFADERWWVFALFGGAVVGLTAVAYGLSARRDLFAGLLPTRLGPATASPELRSPLALAWRLQRGTLLSWSAGFAVIGIASGYVAKITWDLLTANPQLVDFFARLGGDARPSDIVFTLFFVAFGPVIAIYAIQATLRLRAEEVELRAEPVLATPVSRLRWAASHLVFASMGPAIVLAVLGLTGGLTYGLSSGDVGRELPRVLAAAMAFLPALWVLVGLTVVLFGLLPRLGGLSWIALVACVLIELGRELQLVSQPVLDISPFTHVPRVMIGQGSAVPLVWLAGVGAVLTVIGLAGFQRRDVGGHG